MRRFFCSLALLGLAAAPSTAIAQGGLPDTSFGSGGVATVSTAPPGERESGNAMVVDAQDRVLVGGLVDNNDPGDPASGWMLVRFRADGSLDTGFGEGGFARAPGLFGTELGAFGQDIRALAIAPGSGKILAGGMTIGPSKNAEFTIARYNADGSLDMSFGPADTGFVQADISPELDSLEAMAVGPDGSITAGGSCGLDACLARWDSDGALDPSFDGPGGAGDGKFVDAPTGLFDAYRSLEVEPSGAVRAVGVAEVGGAGEWLVSRYTASGARETSFNGTGFRAINFGGGSDLGAGQALVGSTLYVFGSADVDPDPKKTTRTFAVDALDAENGVEIPGTKSAFPLPKGANLFDAAVQSLGGSPAPSAQRFLLAGTGSNLMRLRRVGGDSAALELDPEFGDGGIAPKPTPAGTWGDVAIDSKNRVVAGGGVGQFESADFAAARYLDTAPPDTTAPVISKASISPRAWALNPRGKAEALLSAKRKRKRGTRIRYTLSESAKLVVSVDRRKVKRKGGKKRARFAKVGSFAKNGTAGANSNPFSGRIGEKKLRPGRYRATLVATDAAGNSSAATRLSFTVIPPRR